MTEAMELFREAYDYLDALEDTRKFAGRYLSEGSERTDTFEWYVEADQVIRDRNPDNQRTFAFICVPPGWGKTRGYTVCESARRIAQDRTHRVGLFSKSKSKAENYMMAIKNILKNNERLIDDCGVFIDNSTTANTEKIIVLGHPPSETTPSIANLGMTSQVESLRFNTMIIDDPIDREMAFSEAEVGHFVSRMKLTFIPRLEPGGQLIVIGSRFNQVDGYHWLKENPWFRDRTYVLPALDEDGETTCPERFSTADLHMIRDGMMEFEEDGVTDMVTSSMDWEARFMQDPKAGSEMGFRLDWITPSEKWVIDEPENVRIGIDPAYSTAKTADYTGGVAVGWVGSNPCLYDIMAVRIASGFIPNIVKFRERNKAVKGLVEINNARTMGDDLRRMGEPFKDVVQTTGKILRIGDMEHMFRKSREQGGLLFHERLKALSEWQMFLKEYIYFPDAKHEHILDALQFVLYDMSRGDTGFVDPSGLFE